MKHLAGPFFSEGTFTKNTTDEVDEMMANLEDCANGRWQEISEKEAHKHMLKNPLCEMSKTIDIERLVVAAY